MSTTNTGDESFDAAPQASKRYGDTNDESTPLVLVTMLGHPRIGHTFPATLALRARAYGLTVTHTHDGQLLLRTHILDLAGPVQDRKRFARAYNAYAAARNRGDTAATLRAHRRRHDLRAELRTTTPSPEEAR